MVNADDVVVLIGGRAVHDRLYRAVPVEEAVVETATNVSKSGTVYEVVDDIDDEDDDEESFFRGFFKKK
ncbi:MAG: hypothetical protein IKC20_02420 [Clostridia bacterium]|nr:hypothetical protein [Clostridia bacterium]